MLDQKLRVRLEEIVLRKNWFAPSLIMLLTWLLFIFVPPGAAAKRDKPTISLVKTVIIRDYKGLKIPSSEYLVKRGDYILKILKQRGVIDRLIANKEILNLVKTLNPDLKNTDLILPGQKLILPAGPIKGLMSLPKQKAGTRAEKITKPRQKFNIPYRLQRVKAGERLVVYLRREGVPDKLIFNEYLNLLLKLNPEIRNKNIIYPGQVIRLPIFNPSVKPVEITRKEHSTKPTVEEVKLPQPQAASPQPAKKKTSKAIKAKSRTEEQHPSPALTSTTPAEAAPRKPLKKKSSLALKPPQLPESETLATQAALGIIFTRIGEQFISTGQHYLPLKSGGQITLNASSFPIIKLRNGHRIILDLGRRLPEPVIRLIRTEWGEYTIFQAKPKEKLKALLARLLRECNFPRLYEKGQPFIVKEPIKIKLQGDWVIFAKSEDLSSGQAVVLNLLASPDQGTYPEAASYLLGHKIKVIDFYSRGNLIGPEPLPAFESAGTVPETIIAKNPMDFIMALLNLLGQKFTTDLSIPVIKDSDENKNFSLSVNIPLYFNRNGVDYLVRFENLADELKQILEQQGAKIIILDPKEGAVASARTILAVMGQKHKWGLTLRASKRPPERNIEITIPGLEVSGLKKPLFFTPLELPHQLVSLIEKQKIRVINFRVNLP